MEAYIISKMDLKILSVVKLIDYELNLDEETNSKSIIKLKKCEGLADGNFVVINGAYKQFLFVIPVGGVSSEKDESIVTITLLDISNIFNRDVIEKDIDVMTANGLEDFIALQISENFIVSDDNFLNIDYIIVSVNTHTKKFENTNANNYLYNFHTFLTNCRQNSNITTSFKFEDNKLKINIENKILDKKIVDTTVADVTNYKKTYEIKATAKVSCYCQDTKKIYNLYLKTDRTTTTNKDDTNRAAGNIEAISVEKEENAHNECLNVIKSNFYKHLVEFKIFKKSKLMNVNELEIGTPVLIKTDDDVYDSYISAIKIKDENFVYFKSGKLRINLIDKLKKSGIKSF